MSHPYLFVSPDRVEGNTISLKEKGDIAHLLGSLRCRTGDTVFFSDNESHKYRTAIRSINREEAVFEIMDSALIERTLPHISLFQCILKKNAMEFVIQKTAEIGVSTIIPVASERSVPDITGKKAKLERLQRISDEASMQCRRDFKCRIEHPARINDIDTEAFEYFFFPYEGSDRDTGSIKQVLRDISGAGSIAFLVGPEGGLSENEVSILKGRGALEVNLGKNILRAETAAIYFLSVIDFFIKSGL
jgi:16S rRNA (uracil1498-N3)-methyltransferase